MAAIVNHFIPGLLAALLVIPGAVSAMDSRFELDVSKLGVTAGSHPGENTVRGEAKEHQGSGKGTRARSKKSTRCSREKKKSSAARKKERRRKEAAAREGHSLRLLSVAKAGDEDGIDLLNRVWDKLVPGKALTGQAMYLNTGNFDLSLDPGKYPVIAAADGGKILIDRDRSLPSLVKTLVTGNDPNVRIVAENPADKRRFVKSVLNAAKFYSVEEDFHIEFGSDPKVVVYANYKIENNSDSLLQHDMVLLNVDGFRNGMPDLLVNFLKKEGFRVVESVPPRYDGMPGGDRLFFEVTAREVRAIADSLLSALALRVESDKSLELSGLTDHGIRLKIRADRYFEAKGERYVVSVFNGDPVSYTLMRLIETSGYKVIILDKDDDLRGVSEKFISRLRLNGYYGSQSLLRSRELPYNIEMSGVVINDADRRRTVMMTEGVVEPLVRELAELNGFTFSKN